MNGFEDGAKAHMDGLYQMVKERGGLRYIGVGIPLQRVIAW